MLLFDWNKIVKESGGKAKKAFNIIHHITFKTIPKNKQDIVYSFYGKDFSGSSFLINPEMIFYYFKQYTTNEWIEYIRLASMRNYSNYRVSGETSLSAYIHKHTNNNRLLTVQDSKIFFMFEDA
jgi:hypothetical protein